MTLTMKNKHLAALVRNGDSVVGIKGGDYICCTVDFNDKYIAKKPKKYIPNFKNNILVFSWSDDNYRVLIPNQITEIIPLEKVLRNGERQN